MDRLDQGHGGPSLGFSLFPLFSFDDVYWSQAPSCSTIVPTAWPWRGSDLKSCANSRLDLSRGHPPTQTCYGDSSEHQTQSTLSHGDLPSSWPWLRWMNGWKDWINCGVQWWAQTCESHSYLMQSFTGPPIRVGKKFEKNGRPIVSKKMDKT